jgi:drug/metabolite transporter (DMT)-like permease
MTLAALALILTSAVIHASWNVLAKRASGGPAFVWLFATGSAIIYLPLAIGSIIVQRPVIGPLELLFIAGSSCLHLGYFLLLQRGYATGDLSLVYPLARGTGPTLSTAAAILFLGERPGPIAIAGALLVGVSVFALTSVPHRGGGGHQRAAMIFGLLTGCLIASYTLWDKYAVATLAIPPIVLDWSLGVGRSLTLAPYAMRNRGFVRETWTRYQREILGVAILSPLAYILVLTALTFTPVSYVAPTREVSILIGTAIGARLLSEDSGYLRIAAAGLMVIGIFGLAIG